MLLASLETRYTPVLALVGTAFDIFVFSGKTAICLVMDLKALTKFSLS